MESMTYPDYELDLETPEGDAAEQAAEAAPGWLAAEDGGAEDSEVSPAVEASEWDAHEQGRVVELDDDYR